MRSYGMSHRSIHHTPACVAQPRKLRVHRHYDHRGPTSNFRFSLAETELIDRASSYESSSPLGHHIFSELPSSGTDQLINSFSG